MTWLADARTISGMKYVIWAAVLAGVVIGIPNVSTVLTERDAFRIVALLIVVAVVGNLFKIAQRVDDIAKRK